MIERTDDCVKVMKRNWGPLNAETFFEETIYFRDFLYLVDDAISRFRCMYKDDPRYLVLCKEWENVLPRSEVALNKQMISHGIDIKDHPVIRLCGLQCVFTRTVRNLDDVSVL